MGFFAEQKIRQIFLRKTQDIVGRKKYEGRGKTRLDIGGETVEALYFRKFSARDLSKLWKIASRAKTEI